MCEGAAGLSRRVRCQSRKPVPGAVRHRELLRPKERYRPGHVLFRPAVHGRSSSDAVRRAMAGAGSMISIAAPASSAMTSARKRIMGAAEDDAVGARFYQRRDGPVYELSDGGRVFLASFDRFHEPLAYGRQYPDAGGVFAAQFAEPVASQRSACGEHPDDAATGGSRGRLDGRLHPDEGNGIGCPQPFDGYHRGRIAGQYDKFGSCAEQRAHGIVDIAGHLFGGLFRRRGSVPRRRSRRPTPPAGLLRRLPPDGEAAHA